MKTLEKTLQKTIDKRDKIQKTILSMNDAHFICRNSEFRYVRFRLKSTNKPINFTNLCALFVEYIKTNNILVESGTIHCDNYLKSICKTETTTFFSLLKMIGKIIV